MLVRTTNPSTAGLALLALQLAVPTFAQLPLGHHFASEASASRQPLGAETTGTCEFSGRCFQETVASVAPAGDGLLWVAHSFYDSLFQRTEVGCSSTGICTSPVFGGDLAGDGERLFIAGPDKLFGGTYGVYELDLNDCSVLAECIPPGDSDLFALAWDGELLWRSTAGEFIGFTPPPECAVVSTCPYPLSDLASLAMAACAPGKLFFAERETDSVWRLDGETCALSPSCGETDLPVLGYSNGQLLTSWYEDEYSQGIARTAIDCSSCEVSSRLHEQVLHDGDRLRFDLRVVHLRSRSVSLSPWVWVEDHTGNLLLSQQLAEQDFHFGREVEVRGEFLLDEGFPPGEYMLYLGLEEMVQGSAIVSERFRVEN